LAALFYPPARAAQAAIAAARNVVQAPSALRRRPTGPTYLRFRPVM